MIDVRLRMAALLLVPKLAWAIELPVINPSFEQTSRPLAVGEQTNGAGGAGVPVATRFPFDLTGPSWDNPVEVFGWRTRLRPPGSTDIVYAGVLNPPDVDGVPFVTGQDGQNVFAIQVAQAGQAVNATLQPNTRYRLDFRGGIGWMDFNYFLAVSLIAVDDLATLPLENSPGVQRLALSQGLFPDPSTFGTVLPYALTYTTPEVLPENLQGKYIGVHMYGSDGIPRVVYDDFRLQALSPLACDFDESGDCTATDINAMFALGPIDAGIPVEGLIGRYDLTENGVIDLEDRDAWLAQAAADAGFATPYRMGDANLDGVVDAQDFIRWNQHKFSATTSWSAGNFNGDGFVDGQDFLAWNSNKFASSDTATVPEPATAVGLLSLVVVVCSRRRHGIALLASIRIRAKE